MLARTTTASLIGNHLNVVSVGIRNMFLFDGV